LNPTKVKRSAGFYNGQSNSVFCDVFFSQITALTLKINDFVEYDAYEFSRK